MKIGIFQVWNVRLIWVGVYADTIYVSCVFKIHDFVLLNIALHLYSLFCINCSFLIISNTNCQMIHSQIKHIIISDTTISFLRQAFLILIVVFTYILVYLKYFIMLLNLVVCLSANPGIKLLLITEPFAENCKGIMNECIGLCCIHIIVSNIHIYCLQMTFKSHFYRIRF